MIESGFPIPTGTHDDEADSGEGTPAEDSPDGWFPSRLRDRGGETGARSSLTSVSAPAHAHG
jgi:hypothetical protein